MSKTIPPPPPVTPTKKTAHQWETKMIVTVTEDDHTEVLLPYRRVKGPRRPGVPAMDPHYIFRTEMVRQLLWAIWPHDNGPAGPCLLGGPAGCGKTSLVMQLAARANVPVHRINLNVGTTTRHLKGRVGAQDGSTIFVPGVATMAMEEGAWLLLDEVSGATPPVALALFPILEFQPPGEVILEDAQPPRYVERHEDFRVFATDNTIGAEQEDNRFAYGGTNPDVNHALLDRFGTFIQSDYLTREQEMDAVLKIVSGVDELALEGMIRVAHAVRSAAEIGTGFSTRMVIEWARRYAAGHLTAKGIEDYAIGDMIKIARPAFLGKMRSKIERDAVEEIIRRICPAGGA